MWSDGAALTSRKGIRDRYIIDHTWSLDRVKQLVNSILITNKQRQSL
jgi:hypothetical protein